MALMQIHRTPTPARLVRMGQAPVVIQPEPEPKPVMEEVQSPPVAEPENKKGRRKMADEKKLGRETGVKKISEEDAGTQGAIGSGGVNAPAQEKVPAQPKDDETGKEGE